MKVKLVKVMPNLTRLELGELTIWFSYETPIGYLFRGRLVARENDWGAVTGKHLNHACPDKTKRVKGTDFEDILSIVAG
jgi:hypothetical protein